MRMRTGNELRGAPPTHRTIYCSPSLSAALQAVLLELREDVEAYALGGEGDSC